MSNQEQHSVSIGVYGGVPRSFSADTLVDAVEMGLKSSALLRESGIAGAAGYNLVSVALGDAKRDVMRIFGKPDQALQTWTRELKIEYQHHATLPQEREGVSNPVKTIKLRVQHGSDFIDTPAVAWRSIGGKLVAELLTETVKLYVYSLEDNQHVATVTGFSNAACESKANDVYGSNDYGWTYTPAFGKSDGLIESDEAETINA